MYLESYIDNNDEKLQDNLEMLQKIYYALDEPDGINGVAAVRKGEVSLKEQILEHESSGEAIGYLSRKVRNNAMQKERSRAIGHFESL